jgi:hypothetical protein
MGLDIIIQRDKNDENSVEWLFRTGYGSYNKLMNEIARFFQIQLSDTYYCLNHDDYPEINLDELVEFEKERDFQKYKKIIQNAGDKKVLIPLLMHSDCNGSIPVRLLKDMIPLLETDEIKLWFKLNSEWEEEFFDLVNAIKTAIDADCDLIYS